MSRARRLGVILAALLAASSFAACGERTDDSDRVQEAIERTRRLSARVDYTEQRPTGSKVTVQGFIEDDFRFKARVLYDDQPGWDEVVADDVLAMRMIDAGRVDSLVDKNAAAGTVDQRTELQGITALEALRSRRWVVDESGAPAISSIGVTDDKIGIDPALDALTALDYVSTAVTNALGVNRWSEDELNPTYARTEDPFEKPSAESGLIRYDLVRPNLPPPSDARTSSGGTALPSTKHFRKMAIYVKDGLVVKVDERIEVTGKGLRDFVKYARLMLREFKAPQAERDAFERMVAQNTEQTLGTLLLDDMSKRLVGFGQPALLQRAMTLELNDLGTDITITLPTDQVVKGKLSVMVTSAAAKQPKPTGTQAGGDTGTTTTSTTTGAGGDASTSTTSPTSATTAPSG